MNTPFINVVVPKNLEAYFIKRKSEKKFTLTKFVKRYFVLKVMGSTSGHTKVSLCYWQSKEEFQSGDKMPSEVIHLQVNKRSNCSF